MKLTSKELKHKFLKFFAEHGHVRIPNSPLIPDNDPSALFINSGMHPLIPYLLGEPHPQGTRLMNYQRCIRTVDIEKIGISNRHVTLMEMLGEWSMGDYWKRETMTWTMEFYIEVMGLDPKRIHGTVFRGNNVVPRDEEAISIFKEIFKKYGIEADVAEEFDDNGNSARIIALGKDDNFWTVGGYGPCGPTAEFYYDRGMGEDADRRYLELCNNVFMQYNLSKDGALKELEQKNIDVGWGLERILLVINNLLPNGDLPMHGSVFETDVFINERNWLFGILGGDEEKYENDSDFRHACRLVLDHIRAAVMIIGDGVAPSNKDQGYILRRLIRRSVSFSWRYSESSDYMLDLADKFVDRLSEDEEYSFLTSKREHIKSVLAEEVKKFESVLRNGIKELKKIEETTISGEIAFRLKESLGLPLEITEQIAKQQGKQVDIDRYEELMKEHQEKSRMGGEKKFVGGLGDHSPESIRFHTCAHLFLAAAQRVLGEHVQQKGQNITPERLRYDIAHTEKLTEEQIKAIEDLVNEQINNDLRVDFIEMPFQEAFDSGVTGMFGDKYKKLGTVKVYRIYNPNVAESDPERYFSRELCGGPHVENTREIHEHGAFKIVKEESSSGGVRRIKAILE